MRMYKLKKSQSKINITWSNQNSLPENNNKK